MTSAAPPPSDPLALFERLVVAVEAIAAAQIGRRRPNSALADALSEFFGPSPFTSAGVLMAAEENANLADALSEAIDFNLPPMARSVQLGKLLSRLPGVERVGDRRGAGLFRVAGGG